MNHVKSLKKIVRGYYLNPIENSLLIYWKDGKEEGKYIKDVDKWIEYVQIKHSILRACENINFNEFIRSGKNRLYSTDSSVLKTQANNILNNEMLTLFTKNNLNLIKKLWDL